eukprot:SM000137S00438  [mRNA]  locus=s137:161475:168836:+ [translate_table: standard]
MVLQAAEPAGSELRECLEAVPATPDAVRALLRRGLALTEPWRDRDPWFSAGEYLAFREEELQTVALRLARAGSLSELELLVRRHAATLGGGLLLVLDAIAETVPPHRFRNILPGPTQPSCAPLRRPDWAESDAAVGELGSSSSSSMRDLLKATDEMVRLAGQAPPWPALEVVESWYRQRAGAIDESTGQLEHSMALLNLGIQKGLRGLEPLLLDVADLHAVVYTGASPSSQALGIAAWQGLGTYERFELLLQTPTVDTLVPRLLEVALPFLRRQHRADSGRGLEQGAMLTRWLLSAAARGQLVLCTSILAAASTSQRLEAILGSPAEVAELALQCLYACPATDGWDDMDTLLRAVEPPRPNAGGVADNGGLLAAANRVGQPLWTELEGRAEQASSRLSGALGRVLRQGGHSHAPVKAASTAPTAPSSGEISGDGGFVQEKLALARSHVPKPVAFVAGVHEDEAEVRKLLRQVLASFAREQPPRSDTQWATLWHDLGTLRVAGLATPSDVHYPLAEYCRALLRAGRFGLARPHLRGGASLGVDRAEQLVLGAARDYLYSAPSLDAQAVVKARLCLALLPDSEAVKAESLLVQALVEELPARGVTLLPVQFRQLRTPLDTIAMVLDASPDNYRDPDGLVALAAHVGLTSKEGQMQVLNIIARHAAAQGDNVQATELCLRLVEQGYIAIWDLAATLGRAPLDEIGLNTTLTARKRLLGFALAHCGDDDVGSLLAAWQEADLALCCHHEALREPIHDMGRVGELPSGPPAKGIGSELDGTPEALEELQRLLGPLLSEHLSSIARQPSEQPPSRDSDTMARVALQALASSQGAAPDLVFLTLARAALLRMPWGRARDNLSLAYLLAVRDSSAAADVLDKEVERWISEGGQSAWHAARMAIFFSNLQYGVASVTTADEVDLLVGRGSPEEPRSLTGGMDQGAWAWKQRASKWESWLKACVDASRLENALPGVDTERFAAGDREYVQQTVLSLTGPAYLDDPSALDKAMVLATSYGVPRWEVAMGRVQTVLLSDWQMADIQEEVGTWRTELLARPNMLLQRLREFVYPNVLGTDHTRLSCVLHLLADCHEASKAEEAGRQEGGTEAAARFLRDADVCIALSVSAPSLDFKKLEGLEGPNFEEALPEIKRHVTTHNVQELAGIVATIFAGTGLLSEHDVNLALVQKCLLDIPWRESSEQSLKRRRLAEGYEACRICLQHLGDSARRDLTQLIVTESMPTAASVGALSREEEEMTMALWSQVLGDENRLSTSDGRRQQVAAHVTCLQELLGEAKLSSHQARATLLAVGREVLGVGIEADLLTVMLRTGITINAVLQMAARSDNILGPASENKAFLHPADAPSSSTGERKGQDRVWSLYRHELDACIQDWKIAVGTGSQKGEQDASSGLASLLGCLKAAPPVPGLQSLQAHAWETLQRVVADTQVPLRMRIRVLELLKSIHDDEGGEEGLWGMWSPTTGPPDPRSTGDTAQGAVGDTGRMGLLFLKSADLITSMSPSAEIRPEDLASASAAEDLFMRLRGDSSQASTTVALLALLELWGTSFGSSTVQAPHVDDREAKSEADTGGGTFNDGARGGSDGHGVQGDAAVADGHEGWEGVADAEEANEGWEGFEEGSPESDAEQDADEAGNRGGEGWGDAWEGFDEEELHVSSLHRCWEGIMLDLLGAGLAKEVIRVLDAGPASTTLRTEVPAEPPPLLLTANEAERVSYEEDEELLVALLASGRLLLAAEDATLFSFMCHQLAPLAWSLHGADGSSLPAAESHLHEDADPMPSKPAVAAVVFPYFVAELVASRLPSLAGSIVLQFLGVPRALATWASSTSALQRYLKQELQVLDSQTNSQNDKLADPCVLPGCMARLRGGLKVLLAVALRTILDE